MCSLKQLYSLNKSAPARPPPARHTIVNPQVTLFNSSPKRQLGSVGSPVPSFPLSPDCDFSWIGKTGDVKRRTLAAITWGGWHGLRRYGGGAAEQRMQPVMSSYTLVSIVLYLPHLSQGSPWNLGRRHDDMSGIETMTVTCVYHLKDDLIHFDDITILISSVWGEAEFS